VQRVAKHLNKREEIRSGSGMRLKPRGPNVSVARSKKGVKTGKNHWDRLLHPWQRELEQEKRDKRVDDVKKKARKQHVMQEIDQLMDNEIDSYLGRGGEQQQDQEQMQQQQQQQL